MTLSRMSAFVLCASSYVLLSCARGTDTVDRSGWPSPPWGDSLPRELADVREPVLNASDARPADRATLRFTWVRTFHAPAVLRVERVGADVRLVTTVWSGAGGYEWKVVARRDSVALDANEFSALTRRLNDETFWLPDTSHVEGTDGSTWLIEYRVGNIYRVRSVWAPGLQGREAAVHALGLELIRAAGLGGEEIY